MQNLDKITLLTQALDNFSPVKKEAMIKILELIIAKKPVIIIRNESFMREFENINKEFIRQCLSKLEQNHFLTKEGWSAFIVNNNVFTGYMKSKTIKVEAKDDAYFFGGGYLFENRGTNFSFYVDYNRFYEFIISLYIPDLNNRYLSLFASMVSVFIQYNNSSITQTTLNKKYGYHLIGARRFCESAIYNKTTNSLNENIYLAFKEGFIVFNYE